MNVDVKQAYCHMIFVNTIVLKGSNLKNKAISNTVMVEGLTFLLHFIIISQGT